MSGFRLVSAVTGAFAAFFGVSAAIADAPQTEQHAEAGVGESVVEALGASSSTIKLAQADAAPEAAAETSEEAADDASVDGATVHEVRMLNFNPDDRRQRMLFLPRVLEVAPGDTVKFIAADPGHNSASTKGMIPEGAEPWRSQLSKDFEVTLTVPGVYGYNCTPHQATGMVGLIVVGGEGKLDNLEEAKEVRQIGQAKRIWESIWAEAEEAGVLAQNSAE